MAETLIDNVARSRFELGADGASGFIDYRRLGATLYLNHAEVPAALSGRGLGTHLVEATLDLVRARNERIVPVCPFIKAYIRRHPAYADLRVE